jgi:hypothetical protein
MKGNLIVRRFAVLGVAAALTAGVGAAAPAGMAQYTQPAKLKKCLKKAKKIDDKQKRKAAKRRCHKKFG